MRFNDLIQSWQQDLKIDPFHLQSESANIPVLHNKYLIIYQAEKEVLRKLEFSLSKKRKERINFYKNGADEETWKGKKWDEKWTPDVPAKVSSKDLDMLLESDDEYHLEFLKAERQKDKVAYIDEILKQINNRSFHIDKIIKLRIFEAGN